MEEHSFGFWLRRYRKALDLTQDDLARLVVCSKDSIRKIEAGKQRPSRQIAERLAHYLGISPDEQAAFINSARSERVYTSPPPPASAPWQTPSHQPRSNLPIPPTPLIGRDETIAAVRDRLLREDVRLLTLSGAPGIGKTRLGMQVATELAPTFADGVYFVDLAPVRDPNMVADAIAQTLGLRETGSQALWESLQHYLRSRHTLLLLDNFEHLLAAAPLLAKLLATCARLKLLVTSRALLRLSAEHEFVVPVLALPDLQALPSVGDLAQYVAVDLFVRRTQAHKPDFTLTEANAATVAEICVRLDGLPLALELAAARGKLFAPQALLARLTSRLGLLTGGAHDLPARQQTLRSTIDWSYDLLDASEQALFRRLGVFVGGCTLEAAEAICAGSGLEIEHGERQVAARFSILEGLTALVDRSLLHQAEAVGGEPRFMMLETVREYALERLTEQGELAALRQRHAAFCVVLAERAEPQLTGQDQLAWFTRLALEQGNLRTALEWLLDSKGSPGPVEQAAPLEDGLRLAAALWRFWWMRGQLREGRVWLELAIERSAVDLPIVELRTRTIAPTRREELHRWLLLRAKVLSGAGALARGQADFTAAAAFQETALALYQELGDRKGIATTLNGLGNIAYDQWHFAAARTRFEESLTLHQALGISWSCGVLLNNLANLRYFQGDYAGARALNEESLGLMRRLNSPRGIGYALSGLGDVAHQQGDLALAQAQLEESLVLFQTIDDQRGIAKALRGLGLVALSKGDQQAARAHLEASLTLRREIGGAPDISQTLNSLGDLARAAGDLAEARERYAQSLAILRQLRPTLPVAGALAGLAGLAVTLGHAEHAAELLGAADAIRTALGLPVAPLDRPQHDRDWAAIRTKLPASRLAESTARGRALPLEQVIAEALSALI